MKRLSLLAAILAVFGLLVWRQSSVLQFASVQDQQAAPATPAQPTKQAPRLAPESDRAAAFSPSSRTRVQQAPANPYAAALKEPGKSKRAWDADFIKQFTTASVADPIQFELTHGRTAVGTIRLLQRPAGQLTYMSGVLTAPEPGKFFFLVPPGGGKAGSAVGVVEFPGSQTAFRVEPTGPNGAPELWERRLDEVVCMSMPLCHETAAGSTSTNTTEEIPPLRPDLVPDFVPSWNSNVISLQSFPGSSAVLLLDFFGGYTPTWGGVSYPKPSVSNSQIKDLWKRVAEDYMPFNINVTTDSKVFYGAPASSRMRCVFTPSTSAVGSGAAGVAYIGSWNWGSDTVCWSIYTSGKSGAEVGAHEPGHTLGLGHQGTSTQGYYAGQGSGVVGWAPIMGVGYYDPVATWAKGEYTDANNHEDELNMIVSNNNNVDYRIDDTGSTLATSRYLEIYPGNANNAWAEGVIEQTADTDAFQFTTSGGAVSLIANVVGDWSDLAVMVTLADSNNVVIASNNPQTTLSASIATNLGAGTYTFRVTGAGRNDPLTTGFSTYASLGYYSVTGSVAGARQPTRFSIAERSTNGTVVGVVPLLVTNGDPRAFFIAGGNTGSTFSIDNNGTLRVASSNLLNYEALAQTNVFAPQFELFVNITNTANSADTELNRRVVVLVTNVNEAPTLSGFNVSVVEHTQPGTVIGQVTGSDPDFYTSLLYSFGAGNSNSMFAINSGSGVITVAGDLNSVTQSVYNLSVVVSDQTPPTPLTATSTVTVTVITNRSPWRPGTICYAIYDGLTNTTVPYLTNASIFPRDPTSEKEVTLFEGDTDWNDDYGAVLRGYVIAPASGTYNFWIASDDSSELWFSTTTNPSSATLISSVNGYTGSREWTKFGSQQSAGIALTAGQAYYIEARMKEGGGGDNVAVAWQCTAAGISRDVIPGRYLAPYFMNYLPHMANFTYRLHKDAISGTELGAMTVTDVNENDGHTFAIVSGNTEGIFAIDTNSGVIRIVNETALGGSGRSSYTLSIRTWDTGSPQLSNSATATISLYGPSAITTTTLRQEMWTGIGSGNNVSDLTGNARYPAQPDTLRSLSSIDTGEDYADNYGCRVRGLLRPTNSGSFTFFIASDDASQLKLSTDTNPANASLIASANVSGYDNFSAQASQKSAAISLVAGQSYYIEALQKEGVGGDYLQVAWTGAGIGTTNVIAGSFLSPVDLNYAPKLTNKTVTMPITAGNGTTLTTVTASDSSLDSLTYKIVSGNTGNTFAIDPVTGRITLTNRSQLSFSGGAYSLGVLVQDSGYDGLYPLKSTQAVVSVTITGTNWPPVVTLLTPTNNAQVGSPVTFTASATDPETNLARVEYYADALKIGEATNAPFTFAWSNAAVGPHSLYARAVDVPGNSGTSAVAQITVVPSASVTAISTGAVWKYLDNGSDQGTTWRSVSFNDSSWPQGRAQLGYGDGDEATVVSYGGVSTNKYITTYFRRSIFVGQPTLLTSLSGRLLRDDGAVVYLNGAEVFRSNMPTGTVSYLTLASTAASDDGTVFYPFTVDPALLVSGTNVLAVEIHQNTNTSTDISFDLDLKGVLLVTNPPVVKIATTGSAMGFNWPSDASFYALSSTTNLTVPVTWTPMTNTPVLLNGQWSVTLPASTNGRRFFRLQTQ